MIGVLYPYFICAYAVWTRPLLTKVGQCAQNFGDIKQWLRHTAKKSPVFCLWHWKTPFLTTPDDILAFWFPDGPDPEPAAHLDHWVWRMRGGAHRAVIDGYSDTTKRAVAGDLDHWAATPRGRLALIIVLDQFSRSVFAETPGAYAQDPKALALCLLGLENGRFDALENVLFKAVYKLPMEHCEGPDHLAHLDHAIAISEALAGEAPDRLCDLYAMGAGQPKKHSAVIARFGRHPHRNAILGRVSTPQEEEYLAAGVFPHQTDLKEVVTRKA